MDRPGADLNLVRRAFVFAEQAHRLQRRKNGDPYIGHPVAVARILCDLHMDEEAICAALLHDTVEDTEATLEELAEMREHIDTAGFPRSDQNNLICGYQRQYKSWVVDPNNVRWETFFTSGVVDSIDHGSIISTQRSIL